MYQCYFAFLSLKESSFEETPDEESSDEEKEEVSELNRCQSVNACTMYMYFVVIESCNGAILFVRVKCLTQERVNCFLCRNINQFPKRDCLPKRLTRRGERPRTLVEVAAVAMRTKLRKK